MSDILIILVIILIVVIALILISRWDSAKRGGGKYSGSLRGIYLSAWTAPESLEEHLQDLQNKGVNVSNELNDSDLLALHVLVDGLSTPKNRDAIFEKLKIVLKYGADPSLTDTDGQTALGKAAKLAAIHDWDRSVLDKLEGIMAPYIKSSPATGPPPIPPRPQPRPRPQFTPPQLMSDTDLPPPPLPDTPLPDTIPTFEPEPEPEPVQQSQPLPPPPVQLPPPPPVQQSQPLPPPPVQQSQPVSRKMNIHDRRRRRR